MCIHAYITFFLCARLCVRMGRRSLSDGLCMQRSKNVSFAMASSSAMWLRWLEEGARLHVLSSLPSTNNCTTSHEKGTGTGLHLSLYVFISLTGECLPLVVDYHTAAIV